MADFPPLPREPRMVLPSIQTTSPSVSSATFFTQFKKHVSNSDGSKAANTRLNVSCEGIPPGSRRKFDNHSCFDSPYDSISFQFSQPQITAAMVMKMISSNRF